MTNDIERGIKKSYCFFSDCGYQRRKERMLKNETKTPAPDFAAAINEAIKPLKELLEVHTKQIEQLNGNDQQFDKVLKSICPELMALVSQVVIRCKRCNKNLAKEQRLLDGQTKQVFCQPCAKIKGLLRGDANQTTASDKQDASSPKEECAPSSAAASAPATSASTKEATCSAATTTQTTSPCQTTQTNQNPCSPQYTPESKKPSVPSSRLDAKPLRLPHNHKGFSAASPQVLANLPLAEAEEVQ